MDRMRCSHEEERILQAYPRRASCDAGEQCSRRDALARGGGTLAATLLSSSLMVETAQALGFQKVVFRCNLFEVQPARNSASRTQVLPTGSTCHSEMRYWYSIRIVHATDRSAGMPVRSLGPPKSSTSMILPNPYHREPNDRLCRFEGHDEVAAQNDSRVRIQGPAQRTQVCSFLQLREHTRQQSTFVHEPETVQRLKF